MQTFVDRKWKYGNSASAIFESNREGRGGSDAAMPAFGVMLKESQINELVDYILSGIEEGKVYDFEQAFSPTEVYNAEKFDYTLEVIASDLGIPWGMAFLPKGDILVTDRDGAIYRVMKDGKKVIIRGGPSVYAEGQGGLLDVVRINVRVLLCRREGGPALSELLEHLLRGHLGRLELQLRALVAGEPHVGVLGPGLPRALALRSREDEGGLGFLLPVSGGEMGEQYRLVLKQFGPLHDLV